MTELKRHLQKEDLTPWERLKLVMAILRAPGGCSWDRQQTHESLLPYLIEESYEVVEAIQSGDADSLKDELGDLLCQIVFHAQLASERREFAADDVVTAITAKLIRRHPHIFDRQAELNPREVRDLWERRKVESGEKKELLAGLPASMPALTMAFRVGEKAGGVGFDWDKAEDVIAKIEEEIAEIRRAMAEGNHDHLREEIGDLLFAAASLSRKLAIEPESALKLALAKFRERFARMENVIADSGRKVHHLTLHELEAIWQSIK
ncbi:MAG: nucleoside triphosphate pyrophosphohydrolase [bacterium]